MYTNIVISGGGFQTFGLLGALKNFEEKLGNFNMFHNFLGCSAGSLICLLLCLDYRIDDIIEMLKALYEESKTKIKIKLENILKFFDTYGLIDNIFIEDFIEKILFEKLHKNNVTFVEFCKLTGKNLIINSSNLTSEKEEFFSLDKNPEMNIKLAIRISMCVPIIFKPIKYNNQIYIDGGLYNNFPINYFNFNKIETIGLTLRYNKKKIKNFTDYIRSMINSVLQKNIDNTNIVINTDNIFELNLNDAEELFSFQKLEFLMTKKKISEYISQGYDDFEVFFKNIEEKRNLLVEPLVPS
jgi:predicted acylesterase/phospholipase RssA